MTKTLRHGRSHWWAALALLAAAACSAQPTYDLVLTGGRVIDPGTGLDSTLNVGIRGGTIETLSAEPLAGTTVLDVTGLVVAPGFIDLHAHGQTAEDMTLQAQDGVTSALEMEAGVYPVAAWYASREGQAPIHYGATVGHRPARYKIFHGIDVLHGATNPAVMAPAGPMPAAANAPADESQIEGLEGAIRTGLAEGAVGVGFGINYTPAATTEEIRRLFAVAAQAGVPVFVHTRAFGIGPIHEVLTTAAATGARLHVVHVGSSSLDDLPLALAAIDSARAAGLDVTTEVYPYTAGSTLLQSAMFNPGWQSNLRVGYQDLAWPLTGERLTPATFERYRREGGWVIIHMMKDANVDQAVAHPGVMIASDGVPFVNGTGHPRGAGTYARVLGRYVRERQLLTLTDAIGKMTILPARRLEGHVPAMARKGRIQPGADADITMFDPATVIDRATFAEPTLTSLGIPHVLVAGTFVVRDGQVVVGARPGRPIRSARVEEPGR